MDKRALRGVAKVVAAQDVMEGAGVLVRRAIPQPAVDLAEVDPFLLLDFAEIPAEGPSFPAHPHRGFEIVTYALEGSGTHQDDFGNNAEVEAGGLMRLTAGRGITHSEGQGSRTPARGLKALQMWINLPLALKKTAPEFQALRPDKVPEGKGEGHTIRFLAGEGSPVPLRTPALYRHLILQPGARVEQDVPSGHQGFVLVLEGQGAFGTPARGLKPLDFGVLESEGALVVENTGSGRLQCVLGAGKPLRQPVRWYGPFVD